MVAFSLLSPLHAAARRMKKAKIAAIANTKAMPDAAVRKGCDKVSLRKIADVTVAGNSVVAEVRLDIDVLSLVKPRACRSEAVRVDTLTVSMSRKDMTLLAVPVILAMVNDEMMREKSYDEVKLNRSGCVTIRTLTNSN